LWGLKRRRSRFIAGGFLRATAAKLLSVNRREELNRHLAILAISAPGAVVVWYVFHGVYVNLSESEKVVGYVDPLTQTGVYLGYVAMVGGTLVLAVLAAWSAIACVRLLLRRSL
jgi:hypothetical protein